MNVKSLFNVFLVLVLVSVGVCFVMGGNSLGNSFTAPSDSDYIMTSTNTTTFTLAFNSSWKNVTFVNIYFLNLSGTGTYYNMTHNFTFINGLPTNSTDYNSSFSFLMNTYNFTQGNITFVALIANSSGNDMLGGHFNGSFSSITSNDINATYVNVSVIIDNVAPNSLLLLAPNISQNFSDSSNIQFGFNVTDSMSGNGTYMNCSLYIQGNGSVLLYSNHSIVVWNSTDYQPTYWFNVSSKNIDSGYHVWNISCADYNNNVNRTATWDSIIGGWTSHNSSGGYFTLDDTLGPTTAAPTLSVSSVVESGSVTVTCTGTDIITADPTEYVSIKTPTEVWPAQEDIGLSPYTYSGTGTVGTYVARCRSKDTTGNYGGYSTEASFIVTRSTGSSQTGGGSSGGTTGPSVTVNAFAGQTKDLGNINNGQGIINAYQTSVITFNIGTSSGEVGQHNIKFSDVDYFNEKVTIMISSSDPVTLTMGVGDVESVDIDNDGTDDIEVTLNSIDENGKVNLNVKDLVTTVDEGEEGAATAGVGGEDIGTTGGMSWIWWVLIIIVVVIIIALILPKKK